MACFQNTIQLCFLLSLADYLHTRGETCMEPTKSTCGRQAVISCNKPGMILESVCPSLLVNSNETTPRSGCLSRENSTSSDGRLQLSMSGSTAELHFRPAKLSDQGSYEWYFQGNEAHKLLHSVLTIEETSEEPSISVEEEDLNAVVCKAVGGCPEQIHWWDSNGNPWTQSATFEEKDDAITSTLHLQGSTNQTVYYCTVTYRQLNKTSNATKSITIPGSTTSAEGVKDPQKVTTPDFIPPVVTVLLISVIVVVIFFIWLRRRRSDLEGAIQAEECEEETLQGTTST